MNATNITNPSCGEGGKNDACWMELAVKNKDPAYCQNVSGRAMSGNAPYCYLKVYVALEDSESCGKLYYSSDRMNCYYQISKTKGSGIYGLISNISLNECQSGILVYGTIDRATIAKNQTLCEELTGNSIGYKEQCLTSVFVEIGDAKLCDQLTDYKEGCIYQIQNR